MSFVGEGPWLGTLERAFMRGDQHGRTSVFAPTIPEMLFMFYQMTFAIITVALVAGSVADRMRFSAFVWFAAGWLIFVYVPIAHWVWGGGFLARAGVLDFAGGTVVHLNAGVAGLVAAYVVGKRHGYGHDNFAPYDLSHGGDRHGPALGRLVRVQRRLGTRRQLPRGIRDRRDAPCGIDGCADLDVPGMVDARKTLGARHDLRCGGRPRHHHARVGFRAAVARHDHWSGRGCRMLTGPAHR